MPSCFAIIGSIASTTQKFVNDVRAQALGHFIFELEKKWKYVLQAWRGMASDRARASGRV